MKRTRNYRDLSPEERERYDRLRAIQHRLHKLAVERRDGLHSRRREKIKKTADAMLGLECEPDLRTEQEMRYEKPWRGSTTRYLGDAR